MRKADPAKRRIAIYGATSTIAEHVGRLYAAENAELFLVGRRAAGLNRLREDFIVRGAEAVSVYAADLDEIRVLGSVVEAMGTVNRVLIAYGVLPDQPLALDNPEVAARQFHTNLISPAILLNLLAPKLQKDAAIAVITSVAGDRGRQSNYLYGAAKGGLSRLVEGLRHRLAQDHVRVIDIRPGFVDTAMTDHLVRDGVLWADPERVARDIYRALEHKDGVVYTPWYWGTIMRVIRNLPAPIFNRMRL